MMPAWARRTPTRQVRVANIGATQSSANWSGYVDTGTGITEAYGSWVVPTVAPSSGPTYSSTWVGIDGASNETLIQAGTSQDGFAGQTSYDAWFELIPASESSVTLASDPGDSMAADIVETAPSIWAITLQDVTQDTQFSTTVDYSTPGSSAEWIGEAPLVGGQIATLA